MARRYTRDNRGRFASVGATARGGRLRTAAGNKRATVTERIAGRKPAGTIGTKRTAKPAVPPTQKSTRAPRGEAKPRNKTGKKVDIQLRRAKPGGEYGPDGHWYPGGSFINPGKYVGAKPAAGAGQASASGSGKGGGRDAVTRIIKNKEPAPRPLTPPGRGLNAQKGMNKTAQKLNQEFFSSSGFLNGNMERSFRQAGSNGRAPIDNTRYLGALASRLPEREMRSRTAAALKQLDKQQRRYYIQDVQDARRNLEMTRFGVPRVGASDRQLLNAIRFDTAARNLAGQRAMRRRRGARNSSEEYAWVTNAMLSSSRKRK